MSAMLARLARSGQAAGRFAMLQSTQFSRRRIPVATTWTLAGKRTVSYARLLKSETTGQSSSHLSELRWQCRARQRVGPERMMDASRRIAFKAKTGWNLTVVAHRLNPQSVFASTDKMSPGKDGRLAS